MFIQTSTFYRWDNRYVRDVSDSSRDWGVGVCTLDPDDPHSPDILRAFVEWHNFRGMRSIQAADGRYDHPGVRDLWSQATELGIVINSLIPLQAADELATLLGEFPNLRVVLDHCLSLTAGPYFDATVAKVLELARFPNLYAKLTFLGSGSGQRYPFEDMHEPLKRFIDAYGPERCVWGSDFPTELWCPKVDYAGHLRLFQEGLGLSPSEQSAILGDTAQKLWFDPLD